MPRFNMPFESLSDLNGTDPYIHGEQPGRLLVELSNALVRAHGRPTLDGLNRAYFFLRRGARAIKREYGTLFGARAFRDLVILATDYSDRELRRP